MCLPADLYNRYVRRIESLEAALLILDDTYIKAITSGNIESYSFDSGAGKQSTTYRNPEEIRQQISKLEKDLEWNYRKISQGGGLVNFNLRRKTYINGYFNVGTY